MARTPTGWKLVIEAKTPHQIALFLLSDLLGYRKTSLKRAEDADNLTNLIVALQDIPE